MPANCPVKANLRIGNESCRIHGHKTWTMLSVENRTSGTIHLEYDYAADRVSMRWTRDVGQWTRTSTQNIPIVCTPNIVYG